MGAVACKGLCRYDGNYEPVQYPAEFRNCSLDCDGNFDTTGGTSHVIEGILNGNLSAPADSAVGVAETCLLTPYKDGAATGEPDITIHNRDKDLSALSGAYVIVHKIGSEYRPIWVGCS